MRAQELAPTPVTFRQFLNRARLLNRAVTAYDAAIMVACRRAMAETVGVAEKQHEYYAQGASVRLITYYLAHRELLDVVALRYGLYFEPPNLLVLRHRKYLERARYTGVEIPDLRNVPGLERLHQLDAVRPGRRKKNRRDSHE